MKALSLWKKPNSIWRDSKRKRKRRKKTKIEYEMPKPNPFGEKGMAAPSSSNLLHFLFHFIFLLILINGEYLNSDRSWVMIFWINWAFPTKDLSHCNHRPIFLLSAKQLIAMNNESCTHVRLAHNIHYFLFADDSINYKYILKRIHWLWLNKETWFKLNSAQKTRLNCNHSRCIWVTSKNSIWKHNWFHKQIGDK